MPVCFTDDSGRAVYGCSLAGIPWPNPAGGMYVSFSFVCRQVEVPASG